MDLYVPLYLCLGFEKMRAEGFMVGGVPVTQKRCKKIVCAR